MSEHQQADGVVGSSKATYDVGDGRKLSVSEIAIETGLSRESIRRRLNRGVTGANLLEGAQDQATKKEEGWALFRKKWAAAEADDTDSINEMVIEFGITPEEARANQKRFREDGYRNILGYPILPTGRAPDWLPPWNRMLGG